MQYSLLPPLPIMLQRKSVVLYRSLNLFSLGSILAGHLYTITGHIFSLGVLGSCLETVFSGQLLFRAVPPGCCNWSLWTAASVGSIH